MSSIHFIKHHQTGQLWFPGVCMCVKIWEQSEKHMRVLPLYWCLWGVRGSDALLHLSSPTKLQGISPQRFTKICARNTDPSCVHITSLQSVYPGNTAVKLCVALCIVIVHSSNRFKTIYLQPFFNAYHILFIQIIEIILVLN